MPLDPRVVAVTEQVRPLLADGDLSLADQSAIAATISEQLGDDPALMNQARHAVFDEFVAVKLEDGKIHNENEWGGYRREGDELISAATSLFADAVEQTTALNRFLSQQWDSVVANIQDRRPAFYNVITNRIRNLGAEPYGDGAILARNTINERKTRRCYNRFVKFVMPDLERISRDAVENLVRSFDIYDYNLNRAGYPLVTISEYLDLCVIASRMNEFGKEIGIDAAAVAYLNDTIDTVREQYSFPTVEVRPR